MEPLQFIDTCTSRFNHIMERSEMTDPEYMESSMKCHKYNQQIIAEKITKTWDRFYKKITFDSTKPIRILVSLSGGVDSMSTCFMLRNWAKNKDIDICALHIQYNNRSESSLEYEYLAYWCRNLGIMLYTHSIKDMTRANTDREMYEKETRNIRFKLYKFLMKDYQGGVVLGHIKDDLVENIFRNISMDVNPFQITGMEEISVFDSCTILRPFLNTNKTDIIQFATKYNIPYFYNSTPEWSMRGKFRNELRPLLEKMYGKNICNKFIEYSIKIKEFSEWFDDEYLNTYIEKLTIKDNQILLPFDDNNIKLGSIFWDRVIQYSCTNLKCKKPSPKSLEILYNHIKESRKERRIELNKELYSQFNKDFFSLNLKN